MGSLHKEELSNQLSPTQGFSFIGRSRSFLQEKRYLVKKKVYTLFNQALIGLLLCQALCLVLILASALSPG